MKMHRAMIVALVVVLGALIFAPAAFAQDDNPTSDDLRGEDRSAGAGQRPSVGVLRGDGSRGAEHTLAPEERRRVYEMLEVRVAYRTSSSRKAAS